MKEILTENYESKGPKWCAQETGCSEGYVKVTASKMGLSYARANRNRIRRYLQDNLAVDGWSACANILGLSECSTRRWAKKFSIDGPPDARGARPTNLTDEQVNRVLESYPELSTNVLARCLGLTNDIVIGFLKREGRYLGFDRRSGTAVNKDFFKWSENFAYVFGYMCADGSIGEYRKADTDNRNERMLPQSSITSKDKQILDDIRKAMELKAKVSSYDRDGKPYYTLTTSCDWVYRQWERMGLKPRKTYEGLGVPKIPKSMVRHFIRGFFGGDGGWSEGNSGTVSFGCTDLEFVTWVRNEICTAIDIPCPKISSDYDRDTPFHRFALYSRKAMKCKDWMKPTVNGLFLQRKWPLEIA